MARTLATRKAAAKPSVKKKVVAFPGATRLKKKVVKEMKKSGRYERGARKGRSNVSTKWGKGVRSGKKFFVRSYVAIEIGAHYIVKATDKNSFLILKRAHR